jgi:hypothetical protein
MNIKRMVILSLTGIILIESQSLGVTELQKNGKDRSDKASCTHGDDD